MNYGKAASVMNKTIFIFRKGQRKLLEAIKKNIENENKEKRHNLAKLLNKMAAKVNASNLH